MLMKRGKIRFLIRLWNAFLKKSFGLFPGKTITVFEKSVSSRISSSATFSINFFILTGNEFQTDNRTNQCENKKYTPEICRFFEKNNSNQNRSHGADSCPNRVSRTNGKGLRSFYKQCHADSQANQKTAVPQIRFCTAAFLCFPQAGSKTYFEQPCNN